MKDNLKKCLDRRARMLKSGAAATSLPKCNYFEQMAFLHEKTVNRPTESNLCSPSPGEQFMENMYMGNVLSSPSSDVFSPPPSPVPITKKAEKRKRGKSEEDDSISRIEKTIDNIDVELKKTDQEEDEDTLFCKSLISTFRKLPPRKNKLARIKISQFLFEIEFDESYP